MKFIPINKCDQCNYCETQRDYTSDPWETCYRFDCYYDKDNPKVIERYVGWNEKLRDIPAWCELDNLKE